MLFQRVVFPNTWKKLVSKEYVPKYILNNINQLNISCTFIDLFIGLDGTPEELKLPSSNMWRFPDKDYDKMVKEYEEDPLNSEAPMFISFSCSKDSTWTKRFPGKSTAIILVMSNYLEFEKWKNDRPGNRSEEYKKLKNKYINKILNEGLYHYFPQTKGKVKYCELGTPLTFNNYIGSQTGECYGLDNKPIRYQHNDWLIPKTHIKDLYITGQDITTLGVTGALMAGVLTAHSVLGYGTITDLINDRNLIKDILNIEN